MMCPLFDRFSMDPNGDGLFTISDITHNIWHAFLAPGELTAALVGMFAGDFFEMTCSSHEHWGWVIFGLLLWGGVLQELFTERVH